MPASDTTTLVREAVPLFVSVTNWLALAVPTFTLPNASDVALSVTAGAVVLVPEPESGTVCGDPDALSATLIEAVLVPVAVGVNTTVMVQVAPAATLVPQLFVWLKSPGLPPVSETETPVSAAVPVLVRTVLVDALATPTPWFPKLRDTGLNDTDGTPTLTATAADTLGAKFESPAYCAVSV